MPSAAKNASRRPITLEKRVVAGYCPNTQQSCEITEHDLDSSVVERFEKIARSNGARLAVKWCEGEWSYAELQGHANAISGSIKGFDRTKPVALLLEKKPLAIASMLGVLKAGGFFAPLDPRHPPERIGQMIENAQPELILTEKATESLANTFNGLVRQVRVDCLVPFVNESIPTPADAVAYIIYTSGSTGSPKGVVHTHRNLLHNIKIYSDALKIRAHDRITQLHSVSFSSALVDIFCPLLNGAAVLVWDFHAEGLCGLGDWLERNQATIMIWAPSPFRAMAKSLNKKPASLRLLALGSEPLLDADVELFREHFPESCVLVNRLGATEVNNYRMFFVEHAYDQQGRIVPGGFAVPDKELRLLNAEGRDARPNELGEIIIRSQYISPGYWRQPELSAERFDPIGEPAINDGALCFPREFRTYRTGDLGRLRKDGCLEFHGRADQQVKIRGHRIELGEIEAVLRTCPGVADVAVAARNDGESQVLEAYVVRFPGAALNERELRQSVHERLPVYMIPARFLELSALPTTPTGKLDRRALLNLSNAVEMPLVPGTLAGSPLELQMIRLWESHLGRKGVAADDDFFVLGGDSLQAVQLVLDISTIAGKQVPNSIILEAPTPREMAGRLGSAGWDRHGSCVVPLQPSGSLSALFLVHNCVSEVFNYLALARALAPEQPVYGLRAKLAAPGKLARTRIEEMAVDFVNEIRAVQPEGPYYLAGSAVGALIAYEMAQQLKAVRQRVAWLGILEAWPHHLPVRFHLGRGLIFTWSKLVHHAGRLPRGSIKDLARELKNHAAKAAWAAVGRYRPEIAEANRVRKEAPGAEDLTRIQRALLAAHWAYRPAPYSGEVTLIWSENQGYRLDLPWRELTGTRLKVERVPGGHGSIWRGRNAELLAAVFRRHLAGARATSSA